LVHVVSTPDGAAIYLDDVPQGKSPNAFVVPAGGHRLRLEKEGYASLSLELTLAPGQEMAVREELQDNVGPRIDVGAIPAALVSGEHLAVSARAKDEGSVVGMALLVDGDLAQEVSQASLRWSLDTSVLSGGVHTLTLEARDQEGNVGRRQVSFELLMPTAEVVAVATRQPPTVELPLATETPSPSAMPSLSPTSTREAAPKPTAGATPGAVSQVGGQVSASWGEVEVSTYAYQGALYTDVEGAGHPYPLLDRERVGAPEPRRYRVLRLRNEYLELTFMPELGGRLYQCRFLPTGQDLFYNNRTIKPTRWGPAEQGWWLAVGGMEFCLPVDEHGYLTAEPWDLRVSQDADGSATASMTILERSRNIEAQVDVTLSPGEAGFRVRSALHNPGAEAKSLQYWINAMLSPGSHGVGPSLRFYYPTSEVVVHSRGSSSLPDAGQTMSWPVYGGRDMSLYANWDDWLGFFAPDLWASFTAVYDQDAQLGMVRVFPSRVAAGVKLFGFGARFADVGTYTDDGSQYVEMWGGLTPTFWDYALLEPKSTIAWEETWYVISRSGGPSVATGQAALGVVWGEDHLRVTVSSPGEHRWRLLVTQGDEQIAQEAFEVRPDAPFTVQVDLAGAGSDDQVVISVEDPATQSLVLSYVTEAFGRGS